MRKLFVYLLVFALSLSVYTQNKHYPKFSWDKVPIAFHFGKKGDLMTKSEAKFVASKSNFVVLEKAHGSPSIKYTEDAIKIDAKKLKSFNPDIKVIFYWNAFLDYPMYKAHETYQANPDWWLRKQDKSLDLKNEKIKRYDLSNSEVRDWWTDVAKKEIVNGGTDGVFMDAFIQVLHTNNIKLWGQKKYTEIQKGLKDLINEAREKLGDDKLIVYNGIRSTPNKNTGNNFPANTDVVMIEHFGHFASISKESMLTDIQEMERAGKSGKMVVFKAWPGFAWVDKKAMNKPYKEKLKLSKKNITFPLAAFLAGAQKHSYFIYNWGYRMEMGCLEWYLEFDKPLGKPLNEMIVNGWELTREYEYVSIWVNLETKEAKINWK